MSKVKLVFEATKFKLELYVAVEKWNAWEEKLIPKWKIGKDA